MLNTAAYPVVAEEDEAAAQPGNQTQEGWKRAKLEPAKVHPLGGQASVQLTQPTGSSRGPKCSSILKSSKLVNSLRSDSTKLMPLKCGLNDCYKPTVNSGQLGVD